MSSSYSPLVTIIMATYNREHYIVETLQSIKNQNYTHWECFIIDDGGTDNTKDVIAPLLNQDSRFNFLKRPDSYKKGLPGCRNYGLDLAKGNYIIFFDDDDVIHPQNLGVCLALFTSNPSINYVHYGKQSFKEKLENEQLPEITTYSKKNTPPNVYEELITGTMGFASCTVLWKSSCFTNIRFNDTLLYAEEWECYTRLLIKYPLGIVTDAILYYNRKHTNSNTGEFFSGNKNRKASKIKASTLIISHLDDNQLLTKKLQKFFVWHSVLLKEKSIYTHLKNQSMVSGGSKWKAWFYYSFSPLIKIYLKSKKEY